MREFSTTAVLSTLAALPLTLASPLQTQEPLIYLESHPSSTSPDSHHGSTPPLPLLIWHGLGDRHDASGLHSLGDLAIEVNPGTRVYYVRTADAGGDDRTNTFFGNITAQLADVCAAIATEPSLDPTRDADGTVHLNALGLSQGGQFARALQQTCPQGVLETHNLVTFGAQHNGIAEFQHCGTWDLLCKSASALVGSNAWTAFVQGKVVPAQYYRPVNMSRDTFAETGEGKNGEMVPEEGYEWGSGFLAEVNGERGRYSNAPPEDVDLDTVKDRQRHYAKRVAALESFAMYVFENDTTVVPKESGWFAEVNRTSGVVTDLRDRRLYEEDWIGLKELDEKKGLHIRTVKGAGHMQLSDKVLRAAFGEFFPAKGGQSLEGKTEDGERYDNSKDERLEFVGVGEVSWLNSAWTAFGELLPSWQGFEEVKRAQS